MKTEPIDFLLSSLSLGLAILLGWLVGFVVAPAFTRAVLGVYALLVDALTFLLVFGLSCTLLARLVRTWRPLVPGRHEMSAPVFTAWKLYTVLYEFGCGALKPFTVMFFRPLLQVLFGARIGKEVALGGKLVDPHLITLGDGAIIGEGSVVTAHAITSGAIVLGRVEIGPGATVGVGAVVYPGVRLGAGSIVAANAVVAADTVIPPGEFWGGAPARRIKALQAGD